MGMKPHWQTRVPRFLTLAIAFAFLALNAETRAAKVVASGLSFPFFDDAGKLTHKINARHATIVGALQHLQEVEIEYYENGDPKRVVQRVTATEATWNEKNETLEGRGAVVVETDENRLTGEGFLFELARSQLNIHRNFTMTNREVRLTSDRAVVDLVIDRKGDDVKLRDVKRCEAFGNLHVKVLPTATKKYAYDEMRSTRAIYEGASHTIFLPEETRASKKGQALVLNHASYELDPESRPATKLKK